MSVPTNNLEGTTLPVGHTHPGPKPPPPILDEDSSFEQDDPTLNPPLVETPSKLGALWVAALALAIGGVVLGYALGGLWPWTRLVYPPATADLLKQPDAAQLLNPGPWGDMEVLPMYIEPPEEYLPVDLIEHADRRWHFDGLSTDQLTTLFQTADLTADQRTELLDASKWDVSGTTITLNPSKDLILSLSPEARKQIYAPMLSNPADIYGMLCCSYPADKFDSFFRDSGISAETLGLIKKLSYTHGHLIFSATSRSCSTRSPLPTKRRAC